MFLKRSRWWLRKKQLSPCRRITSCTSQCYFPFILLSSSSCSGSVALHLPWLSLIADHHSQFPQFLSSDLLLSYLHCLFLSNQRSLLLNCRPQTIDIHEVGHSGTAPFICTVSKGTKATSHTMEPFPHVLGVREEQFP